MIELEGIKKVFRMGSQSLEALKGVSLKIERGEFISIMGPSGSGKSTLMNIIGCLDTPTEGEYVLDSDRVAGLSFDQLAAVRNRKIGFVFQNFNLLPYATAWENVELPLLFDGKNARKRKERVTELLKAIGLYDWREHRPSELSGGQQQRIALARALANDPPILLADEPTGNLDSRSGEEIMDILTELWKEGRTIVMVTHNDRISAHSQRIVRLFDGLVLP
ncbi:MAG: ABC transporter ATP-binding protein [Candidatus Aminicenantes bacterium]|nr:ABC transporter ATP-binding protein [Candidatus Aminicenantes bacterium]